jgi:hypothetical protein
MAEGGFLGSAPLGEVGCFARHDSVDSLDDGTTMPGYSPKKHDDRSHDGSANHQDQQRETTSQNIDGVHTEKFLEAICKPGQKSSGVTMWQLLDC